MGLGSFVDINIFDILYWNIEILFILVCLYPQIFLIS